MATERVQKTIKNLRNSTTRQEAMIKAGYKQSYAETSQIKQTKGWQKLMEKYLPDAMLARVHQEGLKAERKQFRNNMTTGEIEEVAIEPDHPTRHRFLDSAYKLKSKYAAEKFELTVPKPPFDYVRNRNHHGDRKDTEDDETD